MGWTISFPLGAKKTKRSLSSLHSQTFWVPTKISTPSYNFDAHDADVILQAPLQKGSDKFKDFHVHKAILSIASTVFHDMFTLPQPPESATGDVTLPSIQVVESAETFEVFLQLIYPIEPPIMTSMQLVDDLFRLTEKYMANGVHVKLKQILLSPSFLKDDPVWHVVQTSMRRQN